MRFLSFLSVNCHEFLGKIERFFISFSTVFNSALSKNLSSLREDNELYNYASYIWCFSTRLALSYYLGKKYYGLLMRRFNFYCKIPSQYTLLILWASSFMRHVNSERGRSCLSKNASPFKHCLTFYCLFLPIPCHSFTWNC